MAVKAVHALVSRALLCESSHRTSGHRVERAWRGVARQSELSQTTPDPRRSTRPSPTDPRPNGGRRATGPRPDGGRRAHARRACSVSSVLTSDMTTLT